MRVKITIFITIVICIISFASLSFAETPRLVDIPVPPNSAGYADFTEEEAEEREKEYEESKNNAVTADYYVGKSSDNYLKSLSIEGYNLYPEFNKQNDTYTIYVKDDNINTFNVTAEADNENAKIEGTGNISVSQEERIINIKVTAENGDLKVYTIKVENETRSNIKWEFIVCFLIILVICLILFFKKYKFKVNRK